MGLAIYYGVSLAMERKGVEVEEDSENILEGTYRGTPGFLWATRPEPPCFSRTRPQVC